MPYIDSIHREYLQDEIEALIYEMREAEGGNTVAPGLVNYVITLIAVRTLKPATGWSYSSLSRALAVFRDAEAEMRRRLLDPYEDKAIQKNGDILEYESP